jgi:hypothetical protein
MLYQDKGGVSQLLALVIEKTRHLSAAGLSGEKKL